MDENNKFKTAFKLYKRKCPPPDLSRVLDFSNLKEGAPVNKIQSVPFNAKNTVSAAEDFVASLMKPPLDWNIYELTDKPGLLFIRNPFTPLGQRYWICRCLRDYTQAPSRLNIDAHNVLEKAQPWWDACLRDNNCDTLRRNLRWATLGYHHNWDTKVYSEDMKDPFPTDIAALARFVSRVAGVQDDFTAEAAIVNFYHFDSTLSGHTDHSEIDLSAPLFSFSFGQKAIFLLGGTSLDIAPTAMYIASGDIVIMSKMSRQCYHGIPKILPSMEFPWDIQQFQLERHGSDTQGDPDQELNESLSINKKLLQDLVVDDKFWEPFMEYILESRINMNVRQVLCPGEKSLGNNNR